MQRLTRSTSFRLTLVILIASALLGLAGSAVAQSRSFELRPGVVVDFDASTVYVMSANGGIDAVSLDYGTVTWHSDSAAKPLAIANGQLLAQAESSQLGVLDLVLLDGSGSSARAIDVELPGDVMARIDDDLTGEFELRATVVDGTFEVTWRSTRRKPRGALIVEDERSPDDESTMASIEQAAQPEIDTGAFTLDPTSMAVAARTQSVDGPQPPQVEVPASERLPAASGRQFFSASRDQILSSEALADPEIGGAAYRWTIYGKTGDRLGQVDSPLAYAPFFVTNSLILFETHPRSWFDGTQTQSEELMLRAIALDSGIEQWSLALRDTRYSGPFPP